MEHFLSEEQLIDYAKPFLKAKGFKKKNKKWTKDIGDFTLCFFIQGSSYSKEGYYIRPGVFINAIPIASWMHGHITTELKQTTPEQILSEFEDWCRDWTNKERIKERLLAVMKWEERRAKSVNYDAGPVPVREILSMDVPPTTPSTRQYVLEHF